MSCGCPTPGRWWTPRRFEELLRLARTRHEPGEAVALLREALGLWQGPAFAGTVGSGALKAAAYGLEELRLVAVEELAGAHGQLGEHGTAAAVLRAEAVARPLREPLIASLMLALGRACRQSEALDWFHRTRRLLADQLGVCPGAVLTDAYTARLRADAPAAAAVPKAPATVSAVDVPQLLPRRPGGFTGRQLELAALDRATVSGPGEDVVAAEPEAAAHLAGLCDGLPPACVWGRRPPRHPPARRRTGRPGRRARP
ncbi:AfsR/SARP family transcriptional regulator [Streptomyces roseoverticillatus]|uniref:AfsR/SARP family transcriptional regulator n=1 Tax=Streptomyces roseoverticillatus TaxID=66429 RepID=UPI0035ABE555